MPENYLLKLKRFISEPLDCLQTERQTENKPIQQTELQVKTWIILYALVFELWKHKNIII